MHTIQSRLAAVLAILLLISFGILGIALTGSQQDLGRQINIAGSQRMLSQRLTQLSFAVAASHERQPTLLKQLEEARKRFAKQLNGLIKGDPELDLSPMLEAKDQASLRDLRFLWVEFERAISVIEKQPDLRAKDATKVILQTNGELLSKMNRAVSLFESTDYSTKLSSQLTKLKSFAEQIFRTIHNLEQSTDRELKDAQLLDSLQTMERQVAKLDEFSRRRDLNGVLPKVVFEELEAIRKNWLPVNILAKKSISSGKVIGLDKAVATLVDNCTAVLNVVNEQNSASNRVINLSGRQRMLTQRMTSFALQLISDPGSQSIRSELRSDISLFDRVLDGLIQGDVNLGLPRTQISSIRALLELIREDWQSFKAGLETILSDSKTVAAVHDSVEQVKTKSEEILLRSHALVTELERINSSQARFNKFATLLLIVIMIIIIAGSYLSFIRPVLKQIVAVIGEVSQSSEKMSAVATELRSTSLNLSDAANMQASSLEETSASMEEMAGMTSQNADFAKQAGTMANKTKSAIANGEECVIRMIGAMEQISASSRKVQKIVRSIQEIAFQTNILSLNAALEAASAGESGRRFTVVADEIRALARRTAKSADETVELIGTVGQAVLGGADIAADLSQRFQDVKNSTQNVSNMVLEIREASSEQAHGISQVNSAIIQMDRITQTNAATAEETASSAQSLSRQSGMLEFSVKQLSKLFGANSRSVKSVQDSAPSFDLDLDAIPNNPMQSSPSSPSSPPVSAPSDADNNPTDPDDESGFVRF